MKKTSRMNTTSISGVRLTSGRPGLDLDARERGGLEIGMVGRGASRGLRAIGISWIGDDGMAGEETADQAVELVGEIIHPLFQKIKDDHRRNGDSQSDRGGQQRFPDTARQKRRIDLWRLPVSSSRNASIMPSTVPKRPSSGASEAMTSSVRKCCRSSAR